LNHTPPYSGERQLKSRTWKGRFDPVLELVDKLYWMEALTSNAVVVEWSTRYSSQFKNNYFTEMCSGSEEGSYLRLIDFCITQL